MGRHRLAGVALVALLAIAEGRAWARPPRVRVHLVVCYAEVRGALSGGMIHRAIAVHRNEIRYCYSRQLIAHPQLAGRVTVRFLIAPGGTVKQAVLASSDLGSPAVEDCVVDHVRHWEFPAVPGGDEVVVDYPFLFEPARQ